MSSINQLKKNHGYVNSSTDGNTCRACIYREHQDGYQGVEGMSANVCTMLYEKEDAGMVILQHVNGKCNEHE